jgi:HEAT repeat protein
MYTRSGVPQFRIITALLLSTSVSAMAQLPEAPPSVTDRATLHRWLEQFKSYDPKVRRDARAAAILAREFPRIEPAKDRETVELLTLGLNDPNAYVRLFSAGCLVKLGHAGVAAIPELEERLTDKGLKGNIRVWASEALAQMYPESVEAFERALLNDDGDVRNAVGKFLIRVPERAAGGPLRFESGFLGPAANPQLAGRFAVLMSDRDPEVRYRAVRALSHLGVDAELAIEPLLQLICCEQHRLAPGEAFVERAKTLALAVATLGETGTSDLRAITTVASLASLGDESVRDSAARALSRLTAQPDLTVPLLTRLLLDPSRNVKIGAAVGLGAYGEKARPAIESIIEVLGETPNRLSRFEIIGAVENIDPAIGQKLRERELLP